MIDRKPHVHAALIKQWADGAQIEVKSHATGQWLEITTPLWTGNCSYRIKPVPHKHQDLIDAFRNGDRTIQVKQYTDGSWYTLTDKDLHMEFSADREIRRAHKWQKEMDAYYAGKAVNYRGIYHSPGSWERFSLKDDGPLSWHTDAGREYCIAPERVVRYLAVDLRGSKSVLYHVTRNSPQDPGASTSNVQFTFEDGKLVDAKVLA